MGTNGANSVYVLYKVINSAADADDSGFNCFSLPPGRPTLATVKQYVYLFWKIVVCVLLCVQLFCKTFIHLGMFFALPASLIVLLSSYRQTGIVRLCTE